MKMKSQEAIYPAIRVITSEDTSWFLYIWRPEKTRTEHRMARPKEVGVLTPAITIVAFTLNSIQI